MKKMHSENTTLLCGVFAYLREKLDIRQGKVKISKMPPRFLKLTAPEMQKDPFDVRGESNSWAFRSGKLKAPPTGFGEIFLKASGRFFVFIKALCFSVHMLGLYIVLWWCW